MKDFSDWNAAVAKAVDALHEPEFPQALQAALATIVPHDIFMVFAYFGQAQPICLSHNIDAARAEVVINAYTRGPYLLDPFYSVATGPERSGVLQLKSLAPDLFTILNISNSIMSAPKSVMRSATWQDLMEPLAWS